MFEDEFDVEVKYKKGGYTVKYWGDYEYAKNIIVSMMINNNSTCFLRVIEGKKSIFSSHPPHSIPPD